MTALSLPTTRILAIFNERLGVAGVQPGLDIVEAGLLDSAGFLRLFLELENEFGIHILNSDLDLNNFRTIEKISDFVSRIQHRSTTT